ATARIGDVRYWRNTGENMGTADQFVQDRLLGVDALAYSLNWADLDVDGDLDLVTGSYDVSLEKQMGELYKETGQSGVFVYQQQADNTFIPTRLAEKAQALALEVSDIDMDGRLDIMVGNDFDTRDQVWLNRDGTWAEATPFTTTTHSTMSFDTGDINNDGSPEFFAADMHPYSDAPEIMEQWQPVIDTMPHNLPADDPQRMFNVLQVRDEAGQYTNLAAQTHVVSDGSGHSIEATGWSWSGKFGDLNQDGFLDFYIVNGMAAQEIFSHLPNDELIEENQAFRNKVGQSFVLAPEWDLGSTRGGRSMSMADLDGDGDLDILVNNLRAPAQIFENQLCEGAALLMDVRWPNSGNTYAIGTQLALHTSTGTYTRRVRVSSGYLSGDAARVHFGLPVNSEIEMLEVRWPDGEVSTVHGLTHQEILQIARQ
ncbi:MAG: CRTAC1 family protein, partial [Chloroflexota bacterium]